MRRGVVPLVLATACLLLVPEVAGAATSEWHSETPVAAGINVPAPLGEVGDIAFWSANRGVLITAGNKGMPAGIYAYDGTGWHLYSTVCGGHEGSVAWTGPDDFWTVADYASAQEGMQSPLEGYARTLCHFSHGEVVASYAEPFGTAYQKMEAAACNGPSDCWFAGRSLPETSPNLGPFHLHWDGSSLTAVPSLEDPQPQIEDPTGTITGLAFLNGGLFESATEAPYLREVSLLSPQVFATVPTPEGESGPFELGGDGAQLWAVRQNGESTLRSIGTGFEAIPVERPLGTVTAVAAEPGGAAAWIGGPGGRGGAAVTRVSATGSTSVTVSLPNRSEELDPKGQAVAMACPAAGQCWMATEKGWLFHLGESLPQDTDPAMHVLITSRPADNSTRSFVPAGVPEDNSGETEASKSLEERIEKFPTPRKRPTLVDKIHRSIVGKRTLVLSFVLHARAHVQLLAKYRHKVVAKTPRLTLAKGPHSLRLKLDPKRWPTGLAFRVHAVSTRSS